MKRTAKEGGVLKPPADTLAPVAAAAPEKPVEAAKPEPAEEAKPDEA